MRDRTNLAWPEAPFGASQRPFARPVPLLAGFALAWTTPPEGLAGVATVYLPTHRTKPIKATEQTLSLGFRCTLAEGPGDAHRLIDLFDRALVRARRHAVAVAAHELAPDLERLTGLAGNRTLPGLTAVGGAWRHREGAERGTATMIDTAYDLPEPAEVDGIGPVQPADLPTALAKRCLTIALAAADTLGKYEIEQPFKTKDALDLAGWDVFETSGTTDPSSAPAS